MYLFCDIFFVLLQDIPNKNINQSQSECSVKSVLSSISSGPIAIPGSPARPSPSRQSSRDSLESLEEGEEGMYYCIILVFSL